MQKYIALIIITIVLNACGNKQNKPVEISSPNQNEFVVTLSEAQLKNTSISTWKTRIEKHGFYLKSKRHY
jgi:hypothetical protein